MKQFIKNYDHFCADLGVTDPEEKCQGILAYCSTKVGKMIEKLPSFNQGEYQDLVGDLQYFLGKEEDPYSLYQVNAFTRKWRKQKIGSLDQFKRYHRKFLELTGKAIGSKIMSLNESNRCFWEGLPGNLRRKIEDRLRIANPHIDTSIPFERDKVVQAVESIFNRKRFDQHLFIKSGYGSSETESEEEEYRPSHLHSDSEEDKEESSEESDRPKRHVSKQKIPMLAFQPPKPPHKSTSSKKAEDDEIEKLTQNLKDLSIYLMQKSPQFRDVVNQAKEQTQQSNRNYNSSNRNPPYNQPPSWNGPRNHGSIPNQVFSPNKNMQNQMSSRGPPPHMTQAAISGPPTNQPNSYCPGCANAGHRMGQCLEINILLNQGTVMRNQAGRLCWPDGSMVYKDREDSWLQAIHKVTKRSNAVKIEKDYSEDEDYEYFDIIREESDASTDEQEELGLFSGPVSDGHALGAERNPRVSREVRKQVQFNSPSGPHGVKKFPHRGNAIRNTGQGPSITQSSNFNGNQLGATKRITPIDVHQDKFKGQNEGQFIPMEVDQGIPIEFGNKGGDSSANRLGSKLPKSPYLRTTPEEVSGRIIQQVLKEAITVPLGDVIDISPTMRRDLLNALKGTYVAGRQTKREKEDPVAEKKVLGSNVAPRSFLGNYEEMRASIPSEETRTVMVPRDDLPTVTAKIGEARMTGVFDSGSQVNVLSEKFMRHCKLPVQTENLHQYRISGIDGGPAVCVGFIPQAKISLTESGLPTIGDLVVVKEAVFDLLLGRPWATGNAAGIREEEEGTFLSFVSLDNKYEVNVAPNPYYLRKDPGNEKSNLVRRWQEPRRPKAIAVATRKEYVSDSEEEEEEEREKESEEEREGVKEMPPQQLKEESKTYLETEGTPEEQGRRTEGRELQHPGYPVIYPVQAVMRIIVWEWILNFKKDI